jgi:hypothetical protein
LVQKKGAQKNIYSVEPSVIKVELTVGYALFLLDLELNPYWPTLMMPKN